MQPLQELVPLWERSLVAAGRRPRGVEKYVWTMHKVIDRLGGASITMADLNRRAVKHYTEMQAMEGRAAMTRINDLAVIRSFCRWAIGEDLRDNDATEGIPRPPKPDSTPRALTDDELDRLLTAIADQPAIFSVRQQWYWRHNRLVIVLGLLTGLRLSEMADLMWDDINLRQRTLLVRCGKGGRAGVVPICDELYTELLAVPESERRSGWAVIPRAIRGKWAGRPLTDSGMAHIFSNWMTETLGISTVTAHRLRHTFASQLLYNDVDLRRIQRLLRHRNLNSTQRYLLLRDKDLDAAVNTLSLTR